MAIFHQFWTIFNGMHQYRMSIYKGVGGKGTGVGWVVAKDKTAKNGKDCRVLRGYDVHIYPQSANIPLQGINRCVLTVKAISDPHRQIGFLH